MSYETRIVGDVVRVTSSRTGAVHDYEIPPGVKPAVHALRCAERMRVSECLDAVRDVRRLRHGGHTARHGLSRALRLGAHARSHATSA